MLISSRGVRPPRDCLETARSCLEPGRGDLDLVPPIVRGGGLLENVRGDFSLTIPNDGDLDADTFNTFAALGDFDRVDGNFVRPTISAWWLALICVTISF